MHEDGKTALILTMEEWLVKVLKLAEMAKFTN